MKKIYKLILTIAMVVCTALGVAFGFSSCTEEVTLLKTEVKTTEVYEGQDLNLADSVLHYQVNDEKFTISLASPDVSVSGFNKATVGEQVVTVTYREQTITFIVNVRSRLTVEGAQTTYFVLEDFNDQEGTVKVAQDDGTFLSLPIADDKITVTGFDSEEENSALELQVTYTDGDVSYTKPFKVKVIEPQITLKKPSKLAYKSHDTALDYSGGYLTVEASGTTKYEKLSDLEVEGFAPEALTIDDYGTPVRQEITVHYKNRTFTFEVEVTYSEVSRIRHYAAELSTLDWTGEELPEITEVQGENALTALQAYIKLDDEDKALISEKDKNSILYPAVVYGYEAWLAEAEKFSNTFVVSGSTTILSCKSYATTKTDLEKLQDTNSAIYTLGEKMSTIAINFNEDVIFETTVGEYLKAVYSAAALENTKAVLSYMVGLYDCLNVEALNGDWSQVDLSVYKANFDAALEMLKNSSYKNYESRFVTKQVSEWRENDDYFELVYEYFYNLTDETEKEAAINVLKDIALPGELEDLYVAIRDSMYQINYLANWSNTGVWDTTEFMTLLNTVVDLMNEFNAIEEETMYKDLYENLKFSGILQKGGKPIDVSFAELYDFVRTTSNGYMSQLQSILGTDLFSKIWEPYIAIITDETEGYYESAKYGEDVEALFNAFAALTPTEQYAFLESLNVFYRYQLQEPILALSVDEGNIVYSTFSMIVTNHYKDVLGEELYPMYQKLVAAMEYYSLRFTYEHVDAGTKFEDNFYELQVDYEALVANAEKAEVVALFDEKLGDIYEKYLAYYEMTFVELDETWSARFKELAKAYRNTYDAYLAIMGDKQNNIAPKDQYALFFSAYLKAEELANAILSEADDEVKKVYYYQEYELDDGWVKYSMDFWALTFKSFYTSIMLDVSLNTTSGSSIILWDVFNTETYEMTEFYLNIYELVVAYNNGVIGELENEYVLEIMGDYMELSFAQRTLFSYFDTYYHMAIRAYYDTVLTATAAKNVATQLWLVQENYLVYLNYLETVDVEDEKSVEALETAKKAFEDEMVILQNQYDNLGEAQDEFNAKLEAVYDYFVERYVALQENQEGTQEGTGTEE